MYVLHNIHDKWLMDTKSEFHEQSSSKILEIAELSHSPKAFDREDF